MAVQAPGLLLLSRDCVALSRQLLSSRDSGRFGEMRGRGEPVRDRSIHLRLARRLRRNPRVRQRVI